MQHLARDQKVALIRKVTEKMPGKLWQALMHLSMLSRWGGRPGIGRGFDVTSLPAVGTFDHSLSSFDNDRGVRNLHFFDPGLPWG